MSAGGVGNLLGMLVGADSIAGAFAVITEALGPAIPALLGVATAITVVVAAVKAYQSTHPSLNALKKDADSAKQECEDI